VERSSLVAVALFGCLSFSGVSQAATLFSESFDDNSKGWKEDNNWNVDSGVYRFTSNDFFAQNQSYLDVGNLISESEWNTGSYSVSFDFRFLSGLVGFYAGASWEDGFGEQNWLGAGIEYDGAAISHLESHGGWTDNESVQAAGVAASWGVGEWHNLGVIVDSGISSLYVDGVFLGQGSIPLHSMNNLGFSSWRSNVEFDNLLVASVEAEAVPEPSSIVLLGLGLAGACLLKKQKKS